MVNDHNRVEFLAIEIAVYQVNRNNRDLLFVKLPQGIHELLCSIQMK